MTLHDMALAAVTSVIWGFGFVAARLALDSFCAPQLTALRFLIASALIVLVPRPTIRWRSLVLIGLTLFTGQFLLLFFAFAHGMPPGLASVTQQTQAFFTVLLAAVFLRDRPTARQGVGMTIAFAGLALIAGTTGVDLELTTLGLAITGAFSWAVGNVLVKRAAGVPIFPLVVWCSLVPPIPALVVSAFDATGTPIVEAVVRASWTSLAALGYLGVLATIVAYATWGRLLQRYPTGAVAPFALLAPCTGVVASAVVFGEVFEPMRYAGMALILGGLTVIAWSRPDATAQGRRRVIGRSPSTSPRITGC
jgi:O-acetylserine/cysteine efflux transporter